MLDNLKVSKIEKSLFMIKPDSYQYKDKILDDLKNKDFELQYVRDVILHKEFLEKLYNTEEDNITKLNNIQYFTEKKATIGIACGENIKERLFEVCGQSYAPDLCDKDSIRYKYSSIREPILINGYEFYVNAIHRSLPQDSEKEIEIYMQEYIRKIERENFDGR